MKWFLFLVSVLLVACGDQKQKSLDNKDSLAAIPPDRDTIKQGDYINTDRTRDSLRQLHDIDSFYTQKCIHVITTNGLEPFDVITAEMIDTLPVKKIRGGFAINAVRRYDKDSMPVYRRITYSNKKYSIGLEQELAGDHPKKIIINGTRLRPGINLDTTLCSREILGVIQLDPENFMICNFNGKEYLYLQGHIENCVGSVCGVSFHILYDPLIRKAIVVEQIRAYHDFGLGKCSDANELAFLSFNNFVRNDYFGYFPYGAKVYVLSSKGKPVQATDKNARPYFIAGYSRDGVDSICVREENIPLR